MALKVEALSKRFGDIEVLRDISFDMARGQSLSIMGPSGSGKSTLLHLLGTLDRPSGGTVEIRGQNPFALPELALAQFRNRGIGFVFQEHHLLPQYSVVENVLIPTLAFGKPSRATRDRARALIDRVGLSHRIDHRPGELSGGERHADLKVALPVQPRHEPMHRVVDATGLKVSGEGEWKVRQHGWRKRRTWRTWHIGVLEATGEIVAQTLTPAGWDDASQVAPLIDPVPTPVQTFTADGA